MGDFGGFNEIDLTLIGAAQYAGNIPARADIIALSFFTDLPTTLQTLVNWTVGIFLGESFGCGTRDGRETGRTQISQDEEEEPNT